MSRRPVCPDCTAPAAAGRVVHADSCPLLADLERTTAADAAWFRQSGRSQRRRPTTASERTEQTLLRPASKPDQEVTLIRQGRGRYVRRFLPSGMADLLAVSGE
ncbi:hypothetical protein [Arthrobacter sp. ISL-65]|uniref:hypothetical protein n=1 Tax=Arthrobacter sp. ISL-65 TaxID=2819112 RepID=UPI001BE9EE2B|nr:hypothetical protein [Arthrobacter sp. ISL-65]MBT2549807.1 hypothetical protein [Arthrobacter sp. ISL-65]